VIIDEGIVSCGSTTVDSVVKEVDNKTIDNWISWTPGPTVMSFSVFVMRASFGGPSVSKPGIIYLVRSGQGGGYLGIDDLAVTAVSAQLVQLEAAMTHVEQREATFCGGHKHISSTQDIKGNKPLVVRLIDSGSTLVVEGVCSRGV
jgi:hypothetical protein